MRPPQIPKACSDPGPPYVFIWPDPQPGPWLPNLPGPLERLCMSLGPHEYLFLGPLRSGALAPLVGHRCADPWCGGCCASCRCPDCLTCVRCNCDETDWVVDHCHVHDHAWTDVTEGAPAPDTTEGAPAPDLPHGA